MATMGEAKRLVRLRRKLKAELEDLELAGLDERAETVQQQIHEVGEKVETIKQEHRRKERGQRRRDREAKERHEAAQKEHDEEMARRQAAREWYRSWIRFRGGRPQPAEQVLATAEQAGHDPADLEAAVVRLRRLKDGVECFGFPGEYLRGSYLPVEELPGHAKV